MATKEIYNDVITSGESEIPYDCSCSNSGLISFDYSLRLKFIEYEPLMGVGGTVEEIVSAELDLPLLLQCSKCDCIYTVIYSNALLYKNVEQLKVNLFTKEVVFRPDLTTTFSIDDLQIKLDGLIDSIRLKIKGKPTKI